MIAMSHHNAVQSNSLDAETVFHRLNTWESDKSDESDESLLEYENTRSSHILKTRRRVCFLTVLLALATVVAICGNLLIVRDRIHSIWLSVNTFAQAAATVACYRARYIAATVIFLVVLVVTSIALLIVDRSFPDLSILRQVYYGMHCGADALIIFYAALNY